MEKVSIILPSYNYAHTVGEAIESVLAQTYPNWELIVMDDGSQDTSVRVIEEYQRKYPDKIKLYFHENRQNRGMVETYRLGLRHCAGDYVAFIEADDVWYPSNLSSKIEILRNNPDTVVVHSGVDMFGEEALVEAQRKKFSWRDFPNEKTTHKPFYAFCYFLKYNFVLSFSTFIVRKPSLEGLDFSIHHQPWLDWRLLAQLSLRGKFYYIPDSLVRWRVHQGNYNRSYCSRLDEYKEGMRLKDDICNMMWRYLGQKKEVVNDELLRALRRTLSKYKIQRFWIGVKSWLRWMLIKIFSQEVMSKMKQNLGQKLCREN